MNEIEKLLQRIKQNTLECQPLINYFDGDHPLAFATEKFKNTFGETLKRMRDNLCPIVVEAPADRMEVINFSGADENKEIAAAAWQLWQRDQMPLVSNEVHVETLKTGKGFVMVWQDPQTLEARFYPQDSRNCAVIENGDTKEALCAGKVWRTDGKRLRLTVMFPDKIYKLITKNEYKAGSSELKADSFTEYEDDFEQFDNDNPFGVVPMFKFEAHPVLADAIPIQDALNKTICDKLVAMEFSAYRQRYVTGLEMPKNAVTGKNEPPFRAGVDRVWGATGENVKFGEFGATDLRQFLEVADAYRLEMARVSGTPLHFFALNVSANMSGEALKTLESRFTKKVARLCLSFGTVWASAMKLALRIEGIESQGSLTTQWLSAEQRSESELLDTLGKKRDILEVPVDTLREEYGYNPESIAKFNGQIQNIPTVIE